MFKQQKSKMITHPRTILVTGASSGIGQALSCYYAEKETTLFLWGRSEEKLKKTAQACEQKGAVVHSFITDLSNPIATMEILQTIMKKNTIEMVILAAGSGDIKPEHEMLESTETLLQLAQLNYVTPSLMANKIARQMIENHIKGHIVFIGSVAAFHSLPFATAYSSSKAGITRFADSLRLAVKKWGIKVTLISPGFIDTPMSQRLQCDKPLLMDIHEATTKIAQAITNNQKQLILPRFFNILKWIDLLAPTCIRDFILCNIKVKQAPNIHE